MWAWHGRDSTEQEQKDVHATVHHISAQTVTPSAFLHQRRSRTEEELVHDFIKPFSLLVSYSSGPAKHSIQYGTPGSASWSGATLPMRDVRANATEAASPEKAVGRAKAGVAAVNIVKGEDAIEASSSGGLSRCFQQSLDEECAYASPSRLCGDVDSQDRCAL